MFFLERACAQQVMALAAGPDGVLEATPQAREEVRAQMASGQLAAAAWLTWPGLLRKLDRENPGYDA
jgi:hypothetical protein